MPPREEPAPLIEAVFWALAFGLIFAALGICGCGRDRLIELDPPTPTPPAVRQRHPPPLPADPNCTARECCNGVDDDGNGKIDDDIPPHGFCYSGPPETDGVGLCAAGVQLCRRGHWECVGEVLPSTEQGNDEDCDGLIPVVAIDLAIVIDDSCSNWGWHGWEHARDGAIAGLSGSPSDAEEAVIVLADPDDYWTVKAPLGSSSAAIDALKKLWGGPGGYEPACLLLQRLCEGLVISWRSDDIRKIDLFADEECQGDNKVAAAACAASAVHVRVWTSTDVPMVVRSYDGITTDIKDWPTALPKDIEAAIRAAVRP